MAKVAVTIKLMPESPEVDLDELERQVKERAEVHSVGREPIAFGLQALKVVALVEDAAGASDKLEEELSGIPGVGNLQVVGLTRLLE